MEQETIWIVVGVVLGTLVLTATVVVVFFCWKRSQRRVRGFSLRAVTPLDDAEFESWRRPSQLTQPTEKYGIRAAPSAVVRDRTDSTMFEKELDLYDQPRTPSPVDLVSPMRSPSSSIRKPGRVRRKSSVASSIADRPPTPYSPASTTNEFPRVSLSSRASHIHYPSVSEASAFRFEFDSEHSVNRQEPGRWV
ncbi:hypothetical protein P153DRAFT_383703 [Dothidotthia symphoricarpi CBS 119687]|uniref:Uncharacterized protein n=1 Tax=Dothidotthia symphoricarpi CBS 119687 TaxID=1392245 RepID=A0A6A6AIH4_9PLEO|nr:uncharacterized protein P153DRAFT_383703 [Dothidotthia symphoricarpi CBS 119687]KAF2131610.1 hypothetical protein P153DRAFT_383703 [Dothidotthia symphoricarpi CBS 119687]